MPGDRVSAVGGQPDTALREMFAISGRQARERMGISPELATELADQLLAAERGGYSIEQLTVRHPELTIDDAYAIQLINVQRGLDAGRVLTGKKIGLTSLAMQTSLGVDQPDFGILFADMEVRDGVVRVDRDVIQPRVEGELAFVLKRDLRVAEGETPTIAEVMAATDYIVPTIEVVGSRIRDWKLTIADTVADNASCGMYLTSERRLAPDEFDLTQIRLSLWRNGNEINSGVGADVMGHPAAAVAWLATCLARYAIPLVAGDIILSGALSAAVPAVAGDSFVCRYEGIADIALDFA
ncbi:MAG: fumarylacetoacetate hydrolase family protein [Bacillota bacterium]|nr:fumarylacetoacetate hydrolase family protein [Bacillota bacterium]